jgi:hypothetical protein
MVIAERRELARYAGKRKFHSQLSKFEKAGLWKRIKGVQEWEWELISHALDRLRQKNIRASRHDIISTIHHSNIIEYKIDFNRKIGGYDERVVLRSKAVVQGEWNLHAVYSLTTKSIVSVWLNHVTDFHDTLDWSLYDKNMKVFL